MPSEDDLWADANIAFAECSPCHSPRQSVSSDDDDDHDDWGVSCVQRELEFMRSRTVRLPDGDIHVCDCNCPYTELALDAMGRPTGDLVCIHTGILVTRRCEERTDTSTGRSTWSADPDMQGGGPMGGQYRKRRDMKKASSAAYQASRQMKNNEMPKAIEAPVAQRAASKRGALCVDEEAPADTGPKRMRVCKKDVSSYDTRRLLIDEATATFTKMLGREIIASKAPPPIDPRLLDFNLLYTAALKKYLKETAACGGRPSMDDVHNVALAVDAVIAEEKRKRAEASLARGGQVTGMRFKADAARLAVALWTGACQTSYLSKARRGADSFRPFCAGVYYAFKRGLSLADGTVLVPKIDEFASALPSSKAIAADATLKSLHASSHRGLCTIHRAIAAAGKPSQAHLVFVESIRAAKSLA